MTHLCERKKTLFKVPHMGTQKGQKRPAFKIAIFKIAVWLGPRKQGKIAHTASVKNVEL